MEKFFTQKLLLMLFMGLFLGGCNLEFRNGFDIVDTVYSTIWSNLDGEYYSIDSNGTHDTATYSSVSFDADKYKVTITNVVKGVKSTGWYYMQLLEESGETNGVIRLYGNDTGKYNEMYMSISVLTNRDGSFLKWDVQSSQSSAISTISSTDYNFASDSLIFRLHKNYSDETAYEINDSGIAIPSEDSFIATTNNAYALNGEKINTNSTTLYVLDDSSVEVMTKSDGSYVAIEYDNNSTKMKMITLSSSFEISKESVVSELDEIAHYDHDLVSPVVLETVEGRTMAQGLSFSEDGQHIFGFNVVRSHEDIKAGYVHKKNVVTEEMNLYLKEFTEEYVAYTNDIISDDDTIPITVTINNLVDESFTITILAETKDCYIKRTFTSYFLDDPEIHEDYKLVTDFDYIHNSYAYNFTVSDDFKTVHDNRNDTTYTYFGNSRYNSDRTYYQFSRYAFDVQANTIVRVYIYLYQYDSNKSKFSDGYMYSYPQSSTVTPKDE